MFSSIISQAPVMLSMDIEHLTEQNALLQRQRVYLSNLVQEKDREIMELQQQLALFTGVPTPLIPQATPYFDSSQIQLRPQEQDQDQDSQQQQYQQQSPQKERSVTRGRKDSRLFSQFGVGIRWDQSAPEVTEWGNVKSAKGL